MCRGENAYYVAPAAMGAGDGTSTANAAHYRSSATWQQIEGLLASDPTTVRFIDGVYADDTLWLTDIGHANHQLTLTSDSVGGAVFDSDYSWNIRMSGARNIVFRDLHFTGSVNNFALHMQHFGDTPTRDIVIEDCTFIDMPNARYGAIGIANQTHDVTIRNSTFQRVGPHAGAHMIYTSHGPYNIRVHNNLFEDDPGDYVRFRDEVGYFEVIGNTFRSTEADLELQRPFVSMPIYNDVNPGDEYFSTQMVVRGNTFEYHSIPATDLDVQWYGHAVSFANFGYNSPGSTYQLSPEQADYIKSGSVYPPEDRITLLKELTGIDLWQVAIEENQYVNVSKNVAYGSWNQYGAPSSGWLGFFDIADLAEYVALNRPEGDYDLDGDVDSNDYIAWKSMFGDAGTGLAADGNGDGIVNLADYSVWRDNLGAGSTAASASLRAVPEPKTIGLTAMLLGMIVWRSRRS